MRHAAEYHSFLLKLFTEFHHCHKLQLSNCKFVLNQFVKVYVKNSKVKFLFLYFYRYKNIHLHNISTRASTIQVSTEKYLPTWNLEVNFQLIQPVSSVQNIWKVLTRIWIQSIVFFIIVVEEKYACAILSRSSVVLLLIYSRIESEQPPFWLLVVCCV